MHDVKTITVAGSLFGRRQAALLHYPDATTEAILADCHCFSFQNHWA